MVSDEATEAVTEIAAQAISLHRTVIAGVDTGGWVAEVQLKDDAREWDSETLAQRILAVAGVAHDRYTAGSERSREGLAKAAADELELDF
ncbi:Uncharacterised protein [Mycobacteroides abscessus subsp. massiliense]|nr:Uncharacterised protein [Mycobacteroides abscessus subsp. abscessus]SIN49050.1 Uncharacterised protein [Mycobacteroides abscessus subsp. bolletii]SKF37725.1 Uncharacterised protein [Mycobacteroides abscessus subsp. massiliense]SHW33187.1 Uncharacterised protein [Mycobacteroides abscessus subsp. abscessus]SHW43795.1 Uncharacterised protein [Mycobacteroides abscessus subsp. abscessus]